MSLLNKRMTELLHRHTYIQLWHKMIINHCGEMSPSCSENEGKGMNVSCISGYLYFSDFSFSLDIDACHPGNPALEKQIQRWHSIDISCSRFFFVSVCCLTHSFVLFCFSTWLNHQAQNNSSKFVFHQIKFHLKKCEAKICCAPL